MIIDQDVYIEHFLDRDLRIEHFGVKGMHWGIRKKEEITTKNQLSVRKKEQTSNNDQSSFQKDLAKHPPKPLTKQERSNVRRASKKFENQRKLSDIKEEDKGWRPTGKQVAIVAIGAAAAAIIGGVVIRKHYLELGSEPFSVDQYKNVVRLAETPNWIKSYSGTHMSPTDFKGITDMSTGRVWGKGDHVTKDLFNQKEIVFPKGHEFFRVSHGTETKFDDITYMLPHKEDLARYELGWKDAVTNVIHFNAKDEIRVPDLHTRLEATREALKAEGFKHITPRMVVDRYDSNTGGGWEWKNGLGAKIVDNLKARGFHAMPDDMDQGVYGELPLVLFDKSRVTDKVNVPWKDVNVKELESILTDIPNRR